MSACTCHPTSSDSVSHKRQLFAIISCLSHSNITHGFAACRATPPSPEPRPTRLSMTAHFEGHWHLQRDAKACGAILRIEALWRARSQLRASVSYRILHSLTRPVFQRLFRDARNRSRSNAARWSSTFWKEIGGGPLIFYIRGDPIALPFFVFSYHKFGFRVGGWAKVVWGSSWIRSIRSCAGICWKLLSSNNQYINMPPPYDLVFQQHPGRQSYKSQNVDIRNR